MICPICSRRVSFSGFIRGRDSGGADVDVDCYRCGACDQQFTEEECKAAAQLAEQSEEQ